MVKTFSRTSVFKKIIHKKYIGTQHSIISEQHATDTVCFYNAVLLLYQSQSVSLQPQ